MAESKGSLIAKSVQKHAGRAKEKVKDGKKIKEEFLVFWCQKPYETTTTVAMMKSATIDDDEKYVCVLLLVPDLKHIRFSRIYSIYFRSFCRFFRTKNIQNVRGYRNRYRFFQWFIHCH